MLDYILENSIKSTVFWILGVLALSILFILKSFFLGGSFPAVQSAKWQAVFLTNNQVYFGRLRSITPEYVALSDVYYLQTATDLEQNQATQSKLNLIKLGGEVHGPEDTIYVPKSSMLFWENMKESSRVVQTIMSTKQ